jgi:hypothetical protein
LDSSQQENLLSLITNQNKVDTSPGGQDQDFLPSGHSYSESNKSASFQPPKSLVTFAQKEKELLSNISPVKQNSINTISVSDVNVINNMNSINTISKKELIPTQDFSSTPKLNQFEDSQSSQIEQNNAKNEISEFEQKLHTNRTENQLIHQVDNFQPQTVVIFPKSSK